MTEKSDILDKKGRYITCRVCGEKFKFTSRKKRSHWEYKKKSICVKRSCGALYCNKPPTERELMILQDKFLASGRKKKYMHDIVKVLLVYSESLVKKFFNNFLQNGWSIKYISENATSFLVEEYYKSDTYYVYGSFGGAMIQKIKQAIFSKSEHLTGVSIDKEYDDGNKAQFEDKTTNHCLAIEDDHDRNALSKNIMEVISGADYRYDPHQYYSGLIHLYLRVINGERVADQFSKAYGGTGRWVYGELMDLMKNEICSHMRVS